MKKILFLTVSFLWLAATASTFSTPQLAINRAEDACFLEPATGFITTSITPTSMTFQWNAVQGAAYFRLKMYDSVNKAMIRNVLVEAKTGINTTTIGDLIPGVAYTINLYSVCANGQESP